MSQTPDQIAQSALDAFGKDRQIDKCIEELGELATVLMKFRHGEAGADAVIDELADVAVTGNTLCVLFGREAVDERVKIKLARLVRLVADQVQAKAEKAKPVKPALRWEADGSAVDLWRGPFRLASVVKPLDESTWASTIGTGQSFYNEQAHAMRATEAVLGLREVPLWTP